MATSTNGNMGSSTLSMEEIAKARKQEVKIRRTLKEARLNFINLVRYCKADVILTRYPVD